MVEASQPACLHADAPSCPTPLCRWAEAMAAQGSGGAFEISQRMTAMVGWGATTDFREDWTWDQAAETYALDPEMAAKLRWVGQRVGAGVVHRIVQTERMVHERYSSKGASLLGG